MLLPYSTYSKLTIYGFLSSPCHTLSGVPHGSIPGPFLYILYIDDISKLALSTPSTLTLYADHILLLHPFYSTSTSTFDSLQSDISLFTSWLSSCLHTINPKKSKYITRKRLVSTLPLPALVLNNTPPELVRSYKYLGVTFTSNLSWSLHISNIHSKSRKILGLTYQSLYHHLPTSAHISLYTALILPLFHCMGTPLSSINSKLLEQVQHFAFNLCTKNWSSDYSTLFSSIRLPTLSSRRDQYKLPILY